MADWQLRGTVILACNCEPGCPCNFNALPTHGDCEGGWDWHIEDGRYGDVELEGLNFSLYCDWPGAIHEGNGDAVTFIDERADERQRDALATLLSGEVGGPWGILVTNTVTKMDGPHFVPYEVELAEQRSSVRAGDVHVLELEPIKNPVSGAETHPRAVLPEGMIFKDGAIARSSTFWIRDGVSYDHSGRYAAVAPFEYSGP
jgi:hypothetical protein